MVKWLSTNINWVIPVIMVICGFASAWVVFVSLPLANAQASVHGANIPIPAGNRQLVISPAKPGPLIFVKFESLSPNPSGLGVSTFFKVVDQRNATTTKEVLNVQEIRDGIVLENRGATGYVFVPNGFSAYEEPVTR